MQKLLMILLILLLTAIFPRETKAQASFKTADFFSVNNAKSLKHVKHLFNQNKKEAFSYFQKKEMPARKKKKGYILLPLDNMICVVPDNDIIYQMRIYYPQWRRNFYPAIIPNVYGNFGIQGDLRW